MSKYYIKNGLELKTTRTKICYFSPLLSTNAAAAAQGGFGDALTSALDTITFTADAGVVIDPESEFLDEVYTTTLLPQSAVPSETGDEKDKKNVSNAMETKSSVVETGLVSTTAAKPVSSKYFHNGPLMRK